MRDTCEYSEGPRMGRNECSYFNRNDFIGVPDVEKGQEDVRLVGQEGWKSKTRLMPTTMPLKVVTTNSSLAFILATTKRKSTTTTSIATRNKVSA